MAFSDTPLYVLLVNGRNWRVSTSPAMLGEAVAECDRRRLAICSNCDLVDDSGKPAGLCPICMGLMLPVVPPAVVPARLNGYGTLPATPLSESEAAAFLAGYGRVEGSAAL